MFLSDCARCGRRELFGPRRVDALVTTESGIEVHYRCRACAAPNVLFTGEGLAAATEATLEGRSNQDGRAASNPRREHGAA